MRNADRTAEPVDRKAQEILAELNDAQDTFNLVIHKIKEIFSVDR